MAKIQPDQSFQPAALCRRIVLITMLSLVVLACIDAHLVWRLLHTPGSSKGFVVGISALSMLLGPAIIAGIWLGARIQTYALSGEELIIRRSFRSPRFSLAGLSSVELSNRPMKGALKLIGNDGLGAISGTFKSEQWGKFKAYLTDPSNAVVLRWKDGACVIVTPAQPDIFRRAVKARMG